MQKRLTVIGITVACWTFLALLFTPQTYLFNLRAPKPLSWLQAFASDAMLFYLWALMTPLIFWLGKRFPLEHPRLIRNLGILFLFSFPCAFLHLILLYQAYSLTLGWISNKENQIPFMNLLIGASATNVMVYWGVLIASQATVYFSRYHDREKSLAQAELQALKTQLHPHFLFNTLNAVSALVYEDAEEAESTIVKLSELLRLSLKTERSQEVSLREELEFLRMYLEIQQTLLQERLKVDWQIAPETFSARVPNMILQPLVENSIRHGIAPRRGAGTIKIEAAKQNGLLVLRVEDDGLGMKYGGVSAADNGIGLENTKTRLRHLYGEAHEFKLENRTSESGVSACIKLPFRESRKKYDGEDTHFNS